MRMMCYSVMTQAYSEKEIRSSPNRSRTYDLPITSSDALPLSYRRLVGVKAIKLGSCHKHHFSSPSVNNMAPSTKRVLSGVQPSFQCHLNDKRSPIDILKNNEFS